MEDTDEHATLLPKAQSKGFVRGVADRASRFFRRPTEGGKVEEYDVGEEDRGRVDAKNPVLDWFGMTPGAQRQYKDTNIYDYANSDNDDDEEESDDDSSIAMWQHGDIPDTEAVRRLRLHGAETGLFLVRRSLLYLCHDDKVVPHLHFLSSPNFALRRTVDSSCNTGN